MGISRYPYPATNNSGNVACSVVSPPDPPPSHEEVTGGVGGGEGRRERVAVRVFLTASTSSQIWRMSSNFSQRVSWGASKEHMHSPVKSSLVPRPHPLTKRNGLANCTFATVSPSNVQNIYTKPIQKGTAPDRSHLLMRRNGLVNQVEFLGLAHTFATVAPSNVQNILPVQKKVRILGRFLKFAVKLTHKAAGKCFNSVT